MFLISNALVYIWKRKVYYYLIRKYVMERYLMIKLDVLNLLEKNGKTKYWLYKQLGMSYQNFSRMINNETKSIQYENIDALCQIFNCTPNEIFKVSDE